jgi:hypothetical protein
MESPSKAYNNNLKKAGTIRKEFTTMFNDIYVNNSRTKTGLGDTNEEEIVISMGKFIPGKIYTYQYDPLLKNVLDWYDTRPVVLVNDVYQAGTGNWIVRGINLNFLPEDIRAATLEQFYRIFESDINKSEEIAQIGKINLAISKIVSFFKDWINVLSSFNSGGIGYQFAYRSYIVGRIKDPRYIEYQHWEIIPWLNPKELVGASIKQIHDEYWRDESELLKGPKK